MDTPEQLKLIAKAQAIVEKIARWTNGRTTYTPREVEVLAKINAELERPKTALRNMGSDPKQE